MRTEAVTYTLTPQANNASKYYSDISSFADETTNRAEALLGTAVEEYKRYLAAFNLEAVRADEEYYLELLSFGILWKVYGRTALATKTAPFVSMAYFAEWRKKHRRWKPVIDFARGIFTTLFLLRETKSGGDGSYPTLSEIDHACKWFEATGEFREQALRFIRWRAFWETKSPAEVREIFEKIRLFASWFEAEAFFRLGQYTENVDKFLSENKSTYLWREDRVSCSRARVEYHLNMVGAELMNRAFKTEYDSFEKKAVLLPGCMRALSAEECKAVKTEKGLLCAGCHASCNVNKVRAMSEKKGHEVYVIPHASDLSLWGPREGETLKGVVASACVTTLVEGGWELKRYNVPAQCVLLNASGCKKHWHRDGMATELDLAELKRRLN